MSQRDGQDRPVPGVGLDRAWVAAHLPHRGAMCLIEQVLDWDMRSARCSTGTHRSGTHPLRAHGRLGAACSIEYAAQATALHAALTAPAEVPAGQPLPAGLLASARAVRLLVDRLDHLEEDLLIDVRCVHADRRTALYGFRLSACERLLAEGRLGLLLPEGSARP